MTAETRRPPTGLGRGLAALIPQRQEARSAHEIPIAAVSPNPHQPRRDFNESQLAQLAESIAEHGVLQPILVSETATGYRLVAGERRLRAAQLAGLERIPAVVRTVGDSEELAFALIENLQRADLNALEEAAAFRQLLDEFGLTQEQIAQRVGRSRSSVANTLRLLEMADAVKRALETGELTEGHARALGGLDDHAEQEEILQLVLGRGLSVRQTEELVRRLRDERRAPAEPTATEQPLSPELERLEQGLRAALGTKVRLTARRRGGRITIEYYDDDDLGRLYERLTGAAL